MPDTMRWKYEIGTGKMSVILSFLMLALFGGLAIWMYSSKNGAFIFGLLLAILMFLVFMVAAFQYLYYKVRIGKDGFFYQTSPVNGRYYEYCEIEKAWISSGKEMNGTQSDYCNIAVRSGSVIRFVFYRADAKAVKYLIKRIEVSAGHTGENVSDEKREYLIDGKVYGKSNIVTTAVLVVVVAILEIAVMPYANVSGTIVVAVCLIILIIRYHSFRVKIGVDGFYFQTMPYNGRYFEYREITECREIEKVYRHRKYTRSGRRTGHHGARRTYYYYFQFTDAECHTYRFQFEKPIYEREVNILKERIERGGADIKGIVQQ